VLRTADIERLANKRLQSGADGMAGCALKQPPGR